MSKKLTCLADEIYTLAVTLRVESNLHRTKEGHARDEPYFESELIADAIINLISIIRFRKRWD